MSVQRQGNWLGQQRIDVPHIRALESSICADFDVLGGLMLGGGSPLIVKGFNIPMTGVVGSPATSIQIAVAGGLVIHYGASESGSVFWAPSTRANEILNSANANVSGSFTTSSTNYVGIDLIRTADTTTSDNVQFLDPNALLELSRTVPLGRTLNYRIVISLIPFSGNSNICPIAKVVTDANNNVTSVVDARRMLFRLGSGGDVPNAGFAYAWPQGRNETTTADVFSGGDKAFGSLADWTGAIMTRLWELGGGEYWYSNTADRNIRLFGEGTVMSSGDYFTWSGTDLTWQNLTILFNNSTGYYNEIANQTTPSAGLTNMAIGECIYVDVDRTQNRTRAGSTALQPVKANLLTLGSPVVPGSRYILAWRTAAGNVVARDRTFLVGQAIAATTSAMGNVELSATASVAATPVVATVLTGGAADVTGLVRDAANTNGVGSLTYTASTTATGNAHIFDNSTAQTGGLIASLRTGGVEKAYIDNAGNFVSEGGGIFAARSSATTVTISGNAPATASVAVVTDNITTQTTGTILSIRTGGTEKLMVDFSGSVVQSQANTSITLKGNRTAADTGADIALTGQATRTAGKLVSFQNNGTEKSSVDFNGNVILPSTQATGTAAVHYQFATQTLSPTFFYWQLNPGNAVSTNYYGFNALSGGQTVPAAPTARTAATYIVCPGTALQTWKIRAGGVYVGTAGTYAGVVNVYLYQNGVQAASLTTVGISNGSSGGISVTLNLTVTAGDLLEIVVANPATVTTSIGLSQGWIEMTYA